MNRNKKQNSWCFTEYTYLDNPFLQTALQHIRYYVYQREICPTTNRPHLQGWVYLHRSHRRRWLKQHIFRGKPHLENSRGSPAENTTYCTKEETREQGTSPVYYPSADEVDLFTRKNQGTRTDLEEISEIIVRGNTNEYLSIVDNFGPTFIRYHRGIQALFHARQSRQCRNHFRNVTVEIIWGDPGVGKTRGCYETEGYGNLFRIFQYNPEWWDGYSGEKAVLLDDFYGQLKLSRLLNILDGYPLQLPTKGGSVWAAYEKVYITSNTNPETWYQECFQNQKLRGAFFRRITSIKEITLPSI